MVDKNPINIDIMFEHKMIEMMVEFGACYTFDKYGFSLRCCEHFNIYLYNDGKIRKKDVTGSLDPSMYWGSALEAENFFKQWLEAHTHVGTVFPCDPEKTYITVVLEYSGSSELVKGLLKAFVKGTQYLGTKVTAVSLGDEVTKIAQLEKEPFGEDQQDFSHETC